MGAGSQAPEMFDILRRDNQLLFSTTEFLL